MLSWAVRVMAARASEACRALRSRCLPVPVGGIVFAGDRGPATRPACCEPPLSSSTDRTDRTGIVIGVAIGMSAEPISLVWISNSFKNPLDSPGPAS